MSRRSTLTLLLAGATGLALAGLAGCSATSKAELESALLALEDHEPLARAGPTRRALALELPDGVLEAEATWLRVPAERHRADTPPVVLVHGTPGSLVTWTDVVFGGEDFDGLARDHDVYALEVVDHGTSRATSGTATFQRCAEWVAALVDALELPPVVLVGHSYGGEFAWRAALDRPDLVASLVLVDSSGYARADDEWLPEEEAMRRWPGARLGWLLNSRERVRAALRPHFRAPVAESLVDEVFWICDNPSNWRAMVDLARDENGTRAAELPRLSVPTLLVWGADDLAYPVVRFARRFERDVPGARLVTIPACGHYPQEERPAALVGALRAFLAEAP